MAHRGRQNADDALAAGLATGKTVRDACLEVGVSERTAYRRLEEPDFRKKVIEARVVLIEQTLGRLAEGATEAATVLRGLLQAESEAVKLGACRAILEQAVNYQKAGDIEQRLADLEEDRKIEEQTP